MRIDSDMQNYVGWKVTNPTRIKDKYGYRVILEYADGLSKIQQKSGFATEKKASADRDQTVASLYNGSYIVYANVRVKEYMLFLLKEDLYKRTESNHTVYNYTGIVNKYIIPALGNKKMVHVQRADIQKLYNEVSGVSRSVAEQVKSIINVSMKYALSLKIISVNPAEGIGLPKAKKEIGFHTRVIDTQKTLTMDQIYVLLEKSRETPIHMQVLFNVLMGLRCSEINGLKYEDIDYVNRTIRVQRQLGKVKGGKKEDYLPKTLTKQEVQLKTPSSYRVLPVPDYVFDAILAEKIKYDKNKRRRSREFQDLGYICCSTYGRPRSRGFHWKYYKKLLADNGLPDIRWHDLRSTYSTILLKNDFNPKAVAKLMGHAKEIVTLDVYVDKNSIISDGIPEIEKYMKEVMPDRSSKGDPLADVRDVSVDMTEYVN